MVCRSLWQTVRRRNPARTRGRYRRCLGYGLDARSIRLFHDPFRHCQVPCGARGRYQPAELQRRHLPYKFSAKCTVVRVSGAEWGAGERQRHSEQDRFALRHPRAPVRNYESNIVEI